LCQQEKYAKDILGDVNYVLSKYGLERRHAPSVEITGTRGRLPVEGQDNTPGIITEERPDAVGWWFYDQGGNPVTVNQVSELTGQPLSFLLQGSDNPDDARYLDPSDVDANIALDQDVISGINVDIGAGKYQEDIVRNLASQGYNPGDYFKYWQSAPKSSGSVIEEFLSQQNNI
jgi:hypothetical protein